MEQKVIIESDPNVLYMSLSDYYKYHAIELEENGIKCNSYLDILEED